MIKTEEEKHRMNSSWKYLFRPVILERGEDVYYSDGISHIQKTKDGWKAVAHGTYDYDVSVIMDGDTVEDMECTCPYAEDGNYCKHMAALLFALENDDFTENPAEENGESIEDILNSMNEEQLRSELADITKENRAYRDRISARYRKTPAGLNDIRRIGMILDSLAYDIGDRDGFIDWRSGFDYVEAFTECLTDNLEPMLDRGEYMTAFEVTKKAFAVLNHVEMDGSSGEHGMIASEIEGYWDRIVHMASEEEKDKIHSWFTGMQRISDTLICSDSIDTILERSFDDIKYLRPLLEKVKSELNDPEMTEWRLRILLDKYRDLLVRMGRDNRECETWLNEHEDNLPVKKIRLEEARRRGDTDAEITILEYLYSNTSEERTRYILLTDLLRAYEKNEDREHIKEILTVLVTKYTRNSEEYVQRLRPMYTPEEWVPVREQIIRNNPGIQIEIFHDEKLYDRLLKALAGCPMQTVEKYRKELQDHYPQELLEMYLLHLRRLSEQHASRPLYEEMQKYMYAAAEIPGGREPIKDLICEWLDRFATRRVMLEIMRKVLYEI